MPFPSKHTELQPVPPNAVPAINDTNLLPKYQHLVGCLLYLAVMTRPDISYYAMWLSQFNAKPTHSHFLLVKHVLRYLAGTRNFALSLGFPSVSLPSTIINKCRMWDVLMQIGPQIPRITRVFRVIPFSLKGCWCHGRLLSRNPFLFRLQRLSTMQ